MKLFQIPSLDDAFKIVKRNKNFSYKKETINDVVFVTFNYTLVDYDEFRCNPKSLELRGITYNLKTGEHFVSCHKFFNYQELELPLDEKFKSENVIEVTEKIDGSLIIPVVCHDKVYLKTKRSFSTKQAKLANKFIQENTLYQKFILFCYHYGLQPLFEIVSPQNRIVLHYPETCLYLIQIRNNLTGNYLPYDDIKYLIKSSNLSTEVKVVTREKLSITELTTRCLTYENVEGWVGIVDFQNPFGFRKFKTNWYFRTHKIVTNLKNYHIVNAILDEKIDDILSCLQNEQKNEILFIQKLLNKFNNYVVNAIETIKKQRLSRKEAALKFKDFFIFPILMKVIYDRKDVYQVIKNFVINNCKSEKTTDNFLKRINDLTKT